MARGRTTREELVEKSFRAPSGAILNQHDLRLLRALEENKTISWSDTDIIFNSGFESRVYFRGRNELTENIDLLEAIAQKLRNELLSMPLTHGSQWCVIGIPTAGTPLAQAMAMVFESALDRFSRPICFRTLRSQLKKHGKDNMWAGGPDLEKHSYATVENVVSTAKAMFEHFEHLEEDGYPTKEMHHLVFADWQLGGMQELKNRGYHHAHTIYKMPDVIAAYVHLGMWPKERYEEMDRRITHWCKEHVPSPSKRYSSARA